MVFYNINTGSSLHGKIANLFILPLVIIISLAISLPYLPLNLLLCDYSFSLLPA
jgi:hypothetical protein